MSLPGFYTLTAAWLALLAVPLVLFYFLKLKRPRLELPSLVLWRQVLADNRVNSPFQKFKRNILLFIQLLLLLLLVLAAMQPYWRGSVSRIHRLPILIDCSASMAALDKPGGATRLQAAREKVGRMIDGLLPDQELCLISFSSTARKRSDFTNNKRTLRDALAQIEVEDVPSNVEDALRMAQALGRSASFEEVMLLTDGNVPERANLELSFKLDYQRLPAAGMNIGITALNARRSGEDTWDVFAQVEGSADADAAAAIQIEQDGNKIARESVSLSKGKSQRMVFRVKGEKATALTARLETDGFDSLASDNIAFLNLPAARPLWVYCPPSLSAYRHALQVLGGIHLFPQSGQNREGASYDLVITDQAAEQSIEGRACFYVGIVPADLAKLMTIAQEGATVVDWRRSAPLLQHVELADVVILDEPRSASEVAERDFENLGYEVLAHGHRGPLLLEKKGDGKLSYYLLFHTDRSTLPYRVGFPIFVSNLVQVAMNEVGLSGARGNRTGALPPLTLLPNRAYKITAPDGTHREDKSDASGALSGVPAPRVGQYQISDGSNAVSEGAALLSASETSLDGVQAIQFNEGLAVAAAISAPKTDRALWKLLAMLGFCVLLGEWWYFQRKPGGFRK